MTTRVLCTVYKSPHEQELYLYVRKEDGLSRVPQALLQRFGAPQPVTTLLLEPNRKLARAEAGKVLAAMASQGYYLQLPPPKEAYMQQINLHNNKNIHGNV